MLWVLPLLGMVLAQVDLMHLLAASIMKRPAFTFYVSCMHFLKASCLLHITLASWSMVIKPQPVGPPMGFHLRMPSLLTSSCPPQPYMYHPTWLLPDLSSVILSTNWTPRHRPNSRLRTINAITLSLLSIFGDLSRRATRGLCPSCPTRRSSSFAVAHSSVPRGLHRVTSCRYAPIEI